MIGRELGVGKGGGFLHGKQEVHGGRRSFACAGARSENW
jgi:hypothetical protein